MALIFLIKNIFFYTAHVEKKYPFEKMYNSSHFATMQEILVVMPQNLC